MARQELETYIITKDPPKEKGGNSTLRILRGRLAFLETTEFGPESSHYTVSTNHGPVTFTSNDIFVPVRNFPPLMDDYQPDHVIQGFNNRNFKSIVGIGLEGDLNLYG